MKSLELSLNKRLLIVEYEKEPETLTIIELVKNGYNLNYPEKLNVICKGSDLTEEIAKGFIPIDEKEARIKYPKAFLISYKRFQNAFIDVIESNGWYWGENPVVKPNKSSNFYFSEMTIFHESESRTFTPSKCLIFEIV